MLVYSPDVKRQLPGGQKTAARVTPQRITKSERNSAVLKNIFFLVVVVVVFFFFVVSVLNTESLLKVWKTSQARSWTILVLLMMIPTPKSTKGSPLRQLIRKSVTLAEQKTIFSITPWLMLKQWTLNLR